MTTPPTTQAVLGMQTTVASQATVESQATISAQTITAAQITTASQNETNSQAIQPLRARFRPWRVACQTAVLVAFIVIPLLNAKNITFLSGNFLSFSLGGLPLVDPLAALQAMLGGGSFASSMLIGAAIVLSLALFMGRIFCSWLCPYGLLSEIVARLRPPTSIPAKPLHFFFRTRLTLTVIGLVAITFALPVPILNQLSMPGWYSRAMQHGAFYSVMLYGSLLFPAVLLLEATLRQRFWCQYVCPQSVLLSLAAAVPLGLRVNFQPRKCTCSKNDRPCLSSCSLNLNPRKPTLQQRLECTNCADCVDACTLRGQALSLEGRKKL